MRVHIYILFFLCFCTVTIYNTHNLYAETMLTQDVKNEEDTPQETKKEQEKEKNITSTNEVSNEEKAVATQPTTVHTDEVVVSATKVDKSLLDVQSSVSVITGKDIERSGARTVGDALKDVPGVELTSDGTQGLKRISIRGEKTSGTLILIDGQRIVENRSLEGTPLLIDPSRIERIEVIKGPASVLYGSDAMGGVINIITKKGGKKPIEAEVFAGYNGNTHGFTEGISLFGDYKGFTYRASIAQNDQGNLRTPYRVVPNTSYGNTDASLYLDYTFLDKYTVGISYDYYHAYIRSAVEPIGLNGTVYKKFAADMPEWQRHKVKTFFTAKNITEYLSRIQIDLFFQENTKLFQNELQAGNAPMVIITNSANTNQQIGFSGQLDWLLGEHTLLITGYEFEYDALLTNGHGKMSALPALGKGYSVEGETITNAIYAQGESTLPQDFVLSYGSRLSVITSGINTHRGKLLAASSPVNGIDIVSSGREKTYVHPVFNLGVMYTGVEDTTFRLSFAQGFRAPNLQERLINSSAAETIFSNPNLQPETSHTIELGGRYFANNFHIDITTFYTFTEDYIIAQPLKQSIGTITYQYQNVGKAHTAGIEADLRYTIQALNLTPYTTVAFIKRLFDYGRFSTWDSGTPEVSGRFGLIYENDFTEQGFSFYADAFANYASSNVYTQPKGAKDRLTMRVGSYITANVHTGVRFGKERQFYMDLMLNNIFNEKYITPLAVRQVGGGYLYEPGFHAMMQIGARF